MLLMNVAPLVGVEPAAVGVKNENWLGKLAEVRTFFEDNKIDIFVRKIA